MKRLLSPKKYGGMRGSSSLSSITLFWSIMLSSLNQQNNFECLTLLGNGIA